MPRFLSHEWVEGFNDALLGFQPLVALAGTAGSDSVDDMRASLTNGPLKITEIVLGVPPDDSSVTLTLLVSDTEVRMEIEAPGGREPSPLDRNADVTLHIPYDAAAALAAGDFDAAEAIRDGRVKVRGNLTTLAAIQGILASAAELTSDLAERTTF